MTGFTLLELLVVVAVLTILMSLLLPAFKMVNNKAKEIACSSNLKQVGHMFSLYNNDYNNWHPMAYKSEYGFYWSNILYSLYLPESKGGLISNGADEYYDYIGYGSNGCSGEGGTIFHCPAQTFSYYSLNGNKKPYPVSYAMSKYLTSTPGTLNSSYDMWKSGNKVDYPSQAMLVMDTGATSVCMESTAYWRDFLPIPAYQPIHAQSRNFLFCDGHSTAMISLSLPRTSVSERQGIFWTGTDP